MTRSDLIGRIETKFFSLIPNLNAQLRVRQIRAESQRLRDVECAFVVLSLCADAENAFP